MIHTCCIIRFRNRRTDRVSPDTLRFTYGQTLRSGRAFGALRRRLACLAVSCIRLVRSRQRSRPNERRDVSGFTALMDLYPGLDGPPHRRQDAVSRPNLTRDLCTNRFRDSCVGCGDAADLFTYCPIEAPEGVSKGFVRPERQTPLRVDSVKPNRHMARVGRSRRNTTPI